MTDEILKELWDAKDKIAQEHGYSVDALAEYYLKKQTARHGRFIQDVGENKAEHGAQLGRSQARAG
ncbi:hypothetical protein CKO42_22655 [Lamprobacter modestohalophilus]|uniref:Uncharacterized protein n=1 Tax=Lamprobacter modestohalophilus TaxID=1064514 RepID=A0A9X1B6S2_9GAMM|nr:hypothetical protein [Lamprobacter modestohalophilus]MBK1621166.1 hypothetical protein [Lamprobacter modestohalophilus]